MDKDAVSRPGRRPKLDNSELTKTGFWIGQVFMLIATVLGVFLASQEGLSQAITFSDLDDQQKNYYLRRSLHDELADNIKLVRQYADVIKDQSPMHFKRYHPRLQFYVWESMKYNPNTLQTPSEYIAGVRRYYAELEEIIDNGEHMSFSTGYFLQQLKEKTDAAEQTTLKGLEQNIQGLKGDLQKSGISVE